MHHDLCETYIYNRLFSVKLRINTINANHLQQNICKIVNKTNNTMLTLHTKTLKIEIRVRNQVCATCSDKKPSKKTARQRAVRVHTKYKQLSKITEFSFATINKHICLIAFRCLALRSFLSTNCDTVTRRGSEVISVDAGLVGDESRSGPGLGVPE